MKTNRLMRINPLFWGFSALMIANLLAVLFVNPARADGQKSTIMLDGNGCTARQQDIRDALGAIKGVSSVDFDSMPGHVIVIHDDSVSVDAIVDAIKKSASPKEGESEGCNAMNMDSGT
jgi:copper chaperone CopZ